jgi:restriction endonuclease S subunit
LKRDKEGKTAELPCEAGSSGNTEKKENRHSVNSASSVVESSISLLVPKAKIAENGEYNLTAERYRMVERRGKQKWPMVKLGEVITLQSGYDLPKQEWRKGNYPIVGSNGTIGHHNAYKEIGPGVVTGRSGTIGKVHFIPDEFYWPHNTSLFVKNFKGNNKRFICYLLQSIDLKSLGERTAAVPSLDRKNAHQLTVSLPPLEDQEEIVDKIESEQKAIDGCRELMVRYEERIKRVVDGVWGE